MKKLRKINNIFGIYVVDLWGVPFGSEVYFGTQFRSRHGAGSAPGGPDQPVYRHRYDGKKLTGIFNRNRIAENSYRYRHPVTVIPSPSCRQ
jgi:hypothetical protein